VAVTDLGTQKVSVDGQEVELTSYGTGCWHLARAAARRKDSCAHPIPHEERDNVIEVLIGRLRRKLDPDGSLQPLETVRGRGYRFRLGES
jgi:two-component system response regulator PhoP